MTVIVQTPYSASVANGVTTVFGFGFQLLNATDLQVKLDGVVQSSGFTINGIGVQAGGNVTFAAPPASNTLVEIQRQIPLARSTDYQLNGDLPSDQVDQDLDRIWQALQDQAYFAGLTIGLPPGDPAAPVTVPPVATRANSVLAFDGSGNAVAVPTADVETVAANVASVNTVAANIAGVNTVAANIGAVLDAPNQAAIATTQAGIATTQAGLAANARNAAQAAQAAAEAALDSFDDRYLGPKAVDPTVDNDGNALLTGALYFNTTSNELKVFRLGVWAAVNTVVSASETAQGIIEIATTAEAQAGTDTTRALTPARLKDAQIQRGTAVTLTTQTAVDFVGIPSWANRVTLMLRGVSTNGTAAVGIRLGTSGGFVTTGYESHGHSIQAAGVASAFFSGLLSVEDTSLAALIRFGRCELRRVTGNEWVFTSHLGVSGAAAARNSFGGGYVALSGALDRVQLLTATGTDQFDAGTVNISWE